MKLHTLDARDPEAVRDLWLSLSAEADHSFYLSWGWMESWLATLAEHGIPVELAVVEEQGEPVAAFFLGRRAVRHTLFRHRGLFLNAAGHPDCNRLFIEFNSFLSRPDTPLRLGPLLERLPGRWESLTLPGLDPERFPGNSLGQLPTSLRLVIVKESVSPYVELAGMGDRDSYTAALSANTRSQIRRAYRRYGERGEVSFRVAGSLQEAERFFAELLQLHRAMWAQRGGHGSSFDHPFALAFHRRLIRRRFDAGEIQLGRLTVGDEAVGLLYNFVYRGQVYCYQSGFRLETDNRLKPGLMAHVEGIVHNARQGQQRYEFLAGADRYKQSLALKTRRLVWARIHRAQPKFWLDQGARRLFRAGKRAATTGLAWYRRWAKPETP